MGVLQTDRHRLARGVPAAQLLPMDYEKRACGLAAPEVPLAIRLLQSTGGLARVVVRAVSLYLAAMCACVCVSDGCTY